MFWNFITQMNISAKEYPILHQHDLSFHLSYQPPLYVVLDFLLHELVLISTNSCSKKSSTTYRGGWRLKWKLRSCWWRIGYSFVEIFICEIKFQNEQCVPSTPVAQVADKAWKKTDSDFQGFEKRLKNYVEVRKFLHILVEYGRFWWI